jgi:hypothetical protein
VFFDRTGLLPSPFKTAYPFPLPITNNYVPVTFADIIAARTKQLLSIGKVIDLYWSGGIDSTCILASLFQHADDKRQFVVHFTHTSVVESGTIFEKYIRHNCQWEFQSVATSRPPRADHLAVSGLLGNHVMGQGSTNHAFGFDTWEQPYTNFIDKHPRMPKQFVEWIEPVIEFYPRKTVTFYDFQRLYHMCFRWHFEQYYPTIKQFKTTIFYDTPEFQQWAMYSNEQPYGNGLMKLPMKNIIRQVFNDPEYYYEKKTVPSQHLVGKVDWTFVLEDGSVV